MKDEVGNKWACSFWPVMYEPDLVRGEYVNVGVILISDDGTYHDAVFTDDWSRAEYIAGTHNNWLTERAKEECTRIAEDVRRGTLDTYAIAHRMRNAGVYAHVLIREPGRSIRTSYDQVLRQMFDLFVGFPPAHYAR